MPNNPISFIQLVIVWIFTCLTVQGQTDSTTTTTPKIVQLSSYIDSLAHAGMQKSHIPGAVITIVTDSSYVFNRAYGFADVENDLAVDNEKTLFRIASITKTFTALAVIQLYEKGLVELHTDIRKYLPDEDFDFLSEEPITLHHLLTHTAGFDLTDTGDAALSPEEVIPIEEMARRHMPDRVHKPGEVYSYSNFGFTLTGYIIQEVSGMPYEDYIRKNILEPLEMTKTDIKQPLPQPYKSMLAKSYEWDGKQIPLTRDYTNTLPGGGIISGGGNMANYMLMHLNAGTFKGRELISKDGHNLLTTQHYGSRETKYGICYAFFENMWTTRRSLEHSGGQLGFVSLMVLIPETGTGVFIAQNNRKEAGGFRYEMIAAILDTLLGEKERVIIPPVPPENFRDIAHNYTGVYKKMDYPKATFEKCIRLFGQFSTEYDIRYDGEGRLTTYGDSYVQVDENLFQMDDPGSNYKVEFLTDESGKAHTLFMGTTKYERISWFEKKRVQQMFLFVSLVILLLLVLSRPIVWIIRKARKRELKIAEGAAGLRKWVYWTGTLLALTALGVIFHFAIYRDQLSDYGVPLSMKIVFFVATMGSILALLSPYFLWKTWKLKSLKTRSKIANTLIILAIIISTLIYYMNNLVGFQYYYR
ncbi:MAG: beta-lactamase family protein [Eudoraea sp.]|nr:beta-lactamase family protein [Eudoraea sp.]